MPSNTFDPPSTLPPAEVAALMVEHGVVKHNTRFDIVFLKSVRTHCYLQLALDCNESTLCCKGHRRRIPLVRWFAL